VSDRTYGAVLDRFEGERAVLLLEADGATADELVVPTALLPPEGRRQDARFTVSVRESGRTEIAYEPAATRRRREAAQRRFDRLSEPLSSGDDGDADGGDEDENEDEGPRS
jgi:hypothetical protein